MESSGAIATSTMTGATVAGVAERAGIAGATAAGVAESAAVIGATVAGTAGTVASTTVAVVNNTNDNKTTEIVTSIVAESTQDISNENISDSDLLEMNTSKEEENVRQETNLEETSEIKEEIPAAEFINMTTEGYSSIESIKVWSEFEVTENERNINGFNEIKTTITGVYPLCKNCIADSILITNDVNGTPYVEINGVKKEFYGWNIEKAEIIDIDCEDEYNEVVVNDGGVSGDPHILIFRDVDGEIAEVGNFSVDYGCEYDSILFNGKGRIIGGKNYFEYLETKIVVEFVEMEEKIAKKYTPDYTELLNKKYIVSHDKSIAFTETDNPDEIAGVDNIINLEKGSEKSGKENGKKVTGELEIPRMNVYYDIEAQGWIPYIVGGSEEYTYKFAVLNVENGKWTVLRDFNSNSSYIYTLNYPGRKQFAVTVKDSKGRTVATNRITVTVLN